MQNVTDYMVKQFNDFVELKRKMQIKEVLAAHGFPFFFSNSDEALNSFLKENCSIEIEPEKMRTTLLLKGTPIAIWYTGITFNYDFSEPTNDIKLTITVG